MADHLMSLKSFCNDDLNREVMMVEEELGVTRVGRRRNFSPHNEPWQHGEERIDQALPQLSRSKMRHLTVRINTYFTKILFSKRSPEWHCEASRFLLDTFNRFSSIQLDDKPETEQSLKELLEHNIVQAKALADVVMNLQNRMELQLNVLYSFVAQHDNQLSAQLAALSGRDSTSMKILAFITAVFLPATVVATLFSMDMFDWQNATSKNVVSSSDEDNGQTHTVSPQFWIYWAVTIPLTIVTLAGWAIWWRVEQRRFDFDLIQKQQDSEEFYAIPRRT
ncbi:uncharacterized protein Z518_08176 [Rhinocladiella mackenziei CBS 650.93]|uniref:Rhinocladiella mackenziei CBS 650.93 unplaced genomic scaffold supercont1.6, whole genome shotgun sequence n=1 Tax=Rhinocladiella mackenziei CBS 650.93 TaxID=1442369 RepID=A0A0D2FJU6_9EURO|nr:uncharacterized protein Z518_08176 [Rhinocladiella mackenziei CBS 650.93]KIX02237.1 hypothetical protein Z518_08176 [Rhinocladiella mackenziei CBS 650.93]